MFQYFKPISDHSRCQNGLAYPAPCIPGKCAMHTHLIRNRNWKWDEEVMMKKESRGRMEGSKVESEGRNERNINEP